MARSQKEYGFGFTACNAMLPEFCNIARLINDGTPPGEIDPSIIGRGKLSTNKRYLGELTRRMRSLTPEQIELLAEGSLDDQKNITHLALCKTYSMYHDFVTDVLLEKTRVYDLQLTDLDYNSFVSRKSIDHPELDEITSKTHEKIRQVIHRMLQQTGLIDSVNKPAILIPSLSVRAETVIINDHNELLKCFLR